MPADWSVLTRTRPGLTSMELGQGVGKMALAGALAYGGYSLANNYFKSGETATGSSAEVVTCGSWKTLSSCLRFICDKANKLETERKQAIKHLTISTSSRFGIAGEAALTGVAKHGLQDTLGTGVAGTAVGVAAVAAAGSVTHAGLFFGSDPAKSPLKCHLVKSDFFSRYASFIEKVSQKMSKMSKTDNIVSVCTDSYNSRIGNQVWYSCIFYRDNDERRNDDIEARQNDMQSRIEARQQKKQNNKILKKYKSMLELDDVLDERSLENVWVGENGDIRENKNGHVVGWATKDGEAFGDFLPFTENRMQKDPRLQKKQKRPPNDMRSRIEARMKK